MFFIKPNYARMQRVDKKKRKVELRKTFWALVLKVATSEVCVTLEKIIVQVQVGHYSQV